MESLSPEFLLENRELVEPSAPWCVWLDNIELAVLLLSQPWMATGGLGRAEMERQLLHLAADLPLGPIYYQRVNRSVAALANRDHVRGHGSGRSRRYAVTPRGFAALILNLQVVRSDPTVDGTEFEFKRALVAVCNIVMEAVSTRQTDWELGITAAGFLDDVERLEVWGRPVITDQVLTDAFDVLHLIGNVRRRVENFLSGAEVRLERAVTLSRLTAEVEPSTARNPFDRTPDDRRDLRRVVDTLRPTAGTAPELAARAAVIRCRSFLAYLEKLADLYSERLGVVDLAAFRRAAGGRG